MSAGTVAAILVCSAAGHIDAQSLTGIVHSNAGSADPCTGTWTFSPATVTLNSTNQWNVKVTATPPAGCTSMWYSQAAPGADFLLSAITRTGYAVTGSDYFVVIGDSNPPTSPDYGTVNIYSGGGTIVYATLPVTDITAPPLVLACPASTGQVGVLYTSSLVATGGKPPYSYSIPGGYIDGIFLGPAGLLSGTPSVAGTFNFTATVSDYSGKPAVTASCSITIKGKDLGPTVACPAGSGAVGTLYSSSITATGGQAPFTFSITAGALPAGLALSASTGAITGRPTIAATASFTAQVADSMNLTATAACKIVISKITMDSLSVTQPATPNAVDGTTPAVTPFTTTNTSSAFATADSADLLTVLKAGTITVRGVNIQPLANANQIQWVLQRDPTDKVDLTQATGCAGHPVGAPPLTNGPPGVGVSFDPEIGNFRLIAYVDANGNGSFDEGEQLRVLRVAVVRAGLLNPATSTFQNTKHFIPGAVEDGETGVHTAGRRDVPALPPAMKILGDYMLEGGGATCTIGVAAISIGDVGNLFRDDFVIDYPDPGAAGANDTTSEIPGGPLPMIDTTRVEEKGKQPSGGDQAFRGNSTQTVKASATGRRISLESRDSPAFGPWKIDYPKMGSPEPWGTTTGGNEFREFVAAFSSSFRGTYLSLNENTWTVTAKGKNDGSGKWMDTFSSVTGNDTQIGNVVDKIQVLGLSFVNQYSYVCNPAPPAGVSCN
jgi:hypothetical protein